MKYAYPYAIIGAGPSGLATARVLQKREIPFIGYESHSDVGGMWDQKNPNSVVYDSAHLISSKKSSELKEFPMPENWPDYISHSLVKEYFLRFAKHFDLKKHFLLSTKVEKVRYLESEDLWEITARNSAARKVRGIFISSGPFTRPLLPNTPGTFTGESLHSAEYKSPEMFRGKKILVVGIGNTGCDISVDAIPFAKEVHVSAREGNFFIPKFLMGRPIDQVKGGFGINLPSILNQQIDASLIRFLLGDPEKYGLPKPRFKIFDKHPVLNSLILHHIRHGNIHVQKEIQSIDGRSVTFRNGHSQNYDLIIYATGYVPHFPYLDSEVMNVRGNIPDFHLHIFHRSLPSLFMIGMVESLSFGWQGRVEQAELVADYLETLETVGNDPLSEFNEEKKKPLRLNRTSEFSLS